MLPSACFVSGLETVHHPRLAFLVELARRRQP